MTSTRQLIVKTAVRDFRKRGAAGVSLRAVARSVGITPMAVYHYFTDKDALIDAIVAAGFEVWDSYLMEAAAAPTALTRLRVRHGVAEFALAGFSSGGLLAANLLARRADVRCAAMAASIW